MTTTGKITKKIDPKVLLSTLWIVVMINMLKADILSLYIPGAVGASYLHYIFIASVEVICLLLIIWNAWKWTE